MVYEKCEYCLNRRW